MVPEARKFLYLVALLRNVVDKIFAQKSVIVYVELIMYAIQTFIIFTVIKGRRK